MKNLYKIYFGILVLMLLMPLIKNINAQTTTAFQRTYGLPGYNYGVSAFQTADSGYMILGNKSGFSGNTDIYVIKTDKNGMLLWDKAIGGDSLLMATDFKQTPDKGMIICGYTNHISSGGYDFLLIKTDSVANIEWLRSFGGNDWDFANSVTFLPGIAYYIAGKTYNNSAGMADAFIAAVDLNGDTLWTRNFGGAGDDVLNCIDTAANGNLIASGFTNSFGAGGYDFYLININTAGDTLWTKTFGHQGDEKAYAARPTIDGGYVIVGSTQSAPAINLDPWLVKTDSYGNYLWDYIYYNNENEEFFDIKQKDNGLYVMAGYTTTWGWGNKELFAHVVKENGDFLHGHTFGGYYDDEAYSAGFASDGGYFFTGTTDSKGLGLFNIFFVKTDTNCFTDTSSSHILHVLNDLLSPQSDISVFPNPVMDFFNVNVENTDEQNILFMLFDNTGRLINSEYVDVMNRHAVFNYNASILPPSVYYLALKGKTLNESVKIVKLKN